MTVLNRRLAAALAGLVILPGVGGLIASGTAHADPAPTVPFTDPAVRGGLLLEDASHTPVTSGTLQADPTFPFTVASDLGRAGDSVATLIVATPRSGQTPDGYTQDQLNDSEPYPVGTTPTNTGGTGKGLTLGEYINLDRAARQDSTDAYAGLYQLRMNTGGPNKSDDASYYQAVIKVTETGVVMDANKLMAATGTWQLVEPLISTTSLTVSPATPVASGTPVTLTSTTSETGPGAVGNVQFLDGTTKLGAPVPVDPSTGAASTSVTPALGNHSFSAVFTPTDATKFDASTSAATAYSVETATTTTLTVTPPSPATYGATVTLNAGTSAGVAGSVQFFDGTTALGAPVPVASGAAATTTTPTGGSHSYSAAFTPADPGTYLSSSSAATPYTVNQAPTTTSLAVTPATSATYGDSVTLTATTPADLAGSVSFTDGTTSLGAPVAVSAGMAATSIKPGAGSHNFLATFTPTDSTDYASSSSVPQPYTVAKAGTTTTLAVSPVSPAAYGASLTLTATTTTGLAGTVQFADAGAPIGSPVAVSANTATVTTVPRAGTHSFTATFTASDATDYAASTSVATPYAVTVVTTATTLTASPASPVTSGTVVTLHSATTPTEAGTVQFLDGTTAVGAAVPVGADGTASTTVTPAVGGHSFTAVFTPTDPMSVVGSTSTAVAYTVNAAPVSSSPAPVAPSLTVTTPKAGTSFAAGPSTLAVAASVSDATGVRGVTVALDNGGQFTLTPSGSGSSYTAKLSLANLKLGRHTLTYRATEATAGLITTTTTTFTLTQPGSVASPNKRYSPVSAPGGKQSHFAKVKFAGAPGSYGFTTKTKGATDTFSFFGNAIDLHFGAGPAEGKVRIMIDGKKLTDVDLFSAKGKAVLTSIKHLAYGVHKVQIIDLGQRNSRSSGIAIVFGYFFAKT